MKYFFPNGHNLPAALYITHPLELHLVSPVMKPTLTFILLPIAEKGRRIIETAFGLVCILP